MFDPKGWRYPGWRGLLYNDSRNVYLGIFAETRFERNCLTESGDHWLNCLFQRQHFPRAIPRGKNLVSVRRVKVERRHEQYLDVRNTGIKLTRWLRALKRQHQKFSTFLHLENIRRKQCGLSKMASPACVKPTPFCVKHRQEQ